MHPVTQLILVPSPFIRVTIKRLAPVMHLKMVPSPFVRVSIKGLAPCHAAYHGAKSIRKGYLQEAGTLACSSSVPTSIHEDSHQVDGTWVQVNKAIINMMRRVEPYIAWGYPNLKSVKELIYKRGHGKVGLDSSMFCS